MHSSIADLTATALQWGINAEWRLTCDDGSSAFLSTNFDSFGITNLGCRRSFSGASPLSGTYFIDCGAGGTVTASWDFALATP
jgi:hypothetical protein